MSWRTTLAWCACLLGALVACGSGGGSGGNPSPATGSATTSAGGATTSAAGNAASTANSGGSAGASAEASSSAGPSNAASNDTTSSGATSSGGTSPTSTGAGGSAGSAPSDGLAAAYPGDVGIESDPAVIFADDFESYGTADDLYDRWDAVYQTNQIRFATEAGDVYAGEQSLEFSVPQQDEELSNATDKLLDAGLDELYLRYYSKFQPPFDVVGSSHNGSMISANYFIDGQATPGVPADGTNKFLVNLEHWRGEAETASPGLLNVYAYHPEQRSQWGDHFFSTGTVLPNSSEPFDFGPNFVARPDITVELDRWYCYEYRVRANTPGERDGRITIWLDGELVADFENLRLRDVPTLRIDRFGLSFHIGSNPTGETKKWYDNVVAATAYVGPMLE